MLIKLCICLEICLSLRFMSIVLWLGMTHLLPMLSQSEWSNSFNFEVILYHCRWFSCHAGDLGSIPGSGRSPGEGIVYPLQYSWASLVAQLVKNPPAMQETWVQSLGWDDPWRRESLPTPIFLPGEFHGLQSMVSQSIGHDWPTNTLLFSETDSVSPQAFCWFFISLSSPPQ